MAEYVLIYFFGLLLAVLANIGIYRLAFFPRRLGPFFPPKEQPASRTWVDRIPIFGWWSLRREATLHGSRYWVRPLLIELLFPFALVALYYWEVQGGLLPARNGVMNYPGLSSILRIQAVVHIVLATLLLIATFIDFDERSIPDSITVVGALVALIGSAIFPHWHVLITGPPGGEAYEAMTSFSPERFDVASYGASGLQMALMSFSLWCFALADRRLILRRGLAKAVQYFFAGLVRHPSWMGLAAMWVLGCITIAILHLWLPHDHWKSFYTSIIGMTFGCSIVWAFRVVARVAVGVEALGFGDVTLMAMVGAFIGWQPVWTALFAGAMVAVLFVVPIWLMTGNSSTPFGPYLAMGTLLVLMGWGYLWEEYLMPHIAVVGGDFIFWTLSGLLLLFGVLMWIVTKLRQAIS